MWFESYLRRHSFHSFGGIQTRNQQQISSSEVASLGSNSLLHFLGDDDCRRCSSSVCHPVQVFPTQREQFPPGCRRLTLRRWRWKARVFIGNFCGVPESAGAAFGRRRARDSHVETLALGVMATNPFADAHEKRDGDESPSLVKKHFVRVKNSRAA